LVGPGLREGMLNRGVFPFRMEDTNKRPIIPIWKDKSGKWIDAKEFGKRFSAGVEGITPLQQVKSQLNGMWFVFIGIIWGLGYTAMNGMWWLFTILIGSLIISATQWIGIKQKYIIFKRLEGGAENV